MLQLEEATEDRVTPAERPRAGRGRPNEEAVVTAEREPALSAPSSALDPDALPTAPAVPTPGAAATVPDGEGDVHGAATAPDLHGAPTAPDSRHPSFMLKRISDGALPAPAPSRPSPDVAPTENLAVTRPERPLRDAPTQGAGRSSRLPLLIGAALAAGAAVSALVLWLPRAAEQPGQDGARGAGAALGRTSSDAGLRLAPTTDQAPDASTERPSPPPRVVGREDDDDAPPPPPPPAALEISPELEAWLQGETSDQRELGRLSLSTVPTVEVWLGYNHLGRTPLRGMQLPVGRFPLRLRGRGGLEETVVVEIRAGQETALKLDLSR
jgi:hypothetical protein